MGVETQFIIFVLSERVYEEDSSIVIEIFSICFEPVSPSKRETIFTCWDLCEVYEVVLARLDHHCQSGLSA